MTSPEEVAFVYGHTHKPYVALRSVPGFPAQVSVANTGGWVVDTAVPAPVQAGVAVLVSESLDTASLQFYRQDAGSTPVPVQFLPPPAGARPSAWHAELAARIDPAAAPWAALAESAAELVAQRHRLQTATVALRDAARSHAERVARTPPGSPARTESRTRPPGTDPWHAVVPLKERERVGEILRPQATGSAGRHPDSWTTRKPALAAARPAAAGRRQA